ncbi:MBOAT family protein [bacterium SCSIO 12741]|nr:MBOAT family protein [bacterium SCSIO 12741]
MVFNSANFLLFFGAFFLLYWFVNKRLSVSFRNALILLASYWFYGAWDWRFLGLIVLSSLIDFMLGQRIFQSKSERQRRLLVGTSLMVNLGILGFFKYFHFFVGSFSQLLNAMGVDVPTSTLEIILPVGISFYTFQTLSYTLDIYKRKIKPAKDWLSFFAFVAFFPQLVAGPIERASSLLPQFYEKKVFERSNYVSGLRLVLWGFFQKIVIADNFGVLADAIFDSTMEANGLTVLVGTFFFGLQIYADFSGYSSIAIGLSRMLGFQLMTNFQTPYLATSFRDFWQRWHISLSTWFRDYLYIPLGGSRKGLGRTYVNLIITFLLSGLWHGANITFLIWGGMHGVLLAVERRLAWHRGSVLYAPVVFGLVMLLWLPFRAKGWSHLSQLLTSLVQFSAYNLSQLSEIIAAFSFTRFGVLLAVLGLTGTVELKLRNSNLDSWLSSTQRSWRWAFYYAVILILLGVGNFSVKPSFIYFQF